jgi:hypothetical protein
MRAIRLAAAFAVVVAAIYGCDRQPTTPTETPGTSFAKSQGTGDPAILRLMNDANDRLRARGLHVAIEGIDYFTIGNSRPSNRLHVADFLWVPSDPRRLAQGNDITYLLATNRATTASGLTVARRLAQSGERLPRGAPMQAWITSRWCSGHTPAAM